MSGARQKDRGDLVNPRGGRDRRAEATPDMPELRVVTVTPEGLRPEAVAVWEEVIPLAVTHLVPTDMPAVRRWIWAWNEFFEHREGLMNEGVTVMGSVGTPVQNPRCKWMALMMAELNRLEAKCGFDPLARMRHGITFAKEQTALEKLKAGAAKPKPGRLAPPKGMP